MNIMKKLAVLVIATAIVLTGCSNSFSGTDADNSLLASVNSANNSLKGGLTAPTLGGTLTTATNPTQQVISLRFVKADIIDVSTIPTAVTIRNLASAANATSTVAQGAVIPFTVKEVRSDATHDFVYLLVNLTGASATLEVQVNATILTGMNGTKQLDLDGDNVQGEANDDDFYDYIAVTGGAAIATFGVERNPQAEMNLPTAAFSIVAPATTLNTLTVTYDRQTVAGAAVDLADYKALFDSHIVIETYAAATNTWTAVAPTTTTYATASGDYVSTFAALAAGTQVRARTINMQTLVTTAAFYGFVQRAAMDAQTTEAIIADDAAADATEISVGDQDAALAVSVESTNSYDIKVVIDVNAAITGALGLDFTTVTPDNIRIYNTTKGIFVPLTAANFATGYAAGVVPALTTTPKTQIIISLDSAYKTSVNAFQVWVGPGLKTLGDTGGAPLAVRKFGDASQLSSVPYGFLALDSDGSAL